MTTRTSRLAVWVGLLLSWAFLVPAPLWAQEAPVTTLDLTPQLGTGRAEATAVNESGWVVGSAPRPDGAWGTIGFLWNDENGYCELETGCDPSTAPADINNSNQVVGSGLIGTTRVAFVWEGGMMTLLPSPNPDAPSDSAVAINDVGQIIGESQSRAVVWEKDAQGNYQVSALPGLADYWSSPKEFNTSGRIAGTAGIGSNGWEQRAVMWSRGGRRPSLAGKAYPCGPTFLGSTRRSEDGPENLVGVLKTLGNRTPKLFSGRAGTWGRCSACGRELEWTFPIWGKQTGG